MSQSTEYCKGKTKSGERCSIPPGPSGYCHVHDPEKKTAAKLAQEEEVRQEKAKVQARELKLEKINEAISWLESEIKNRVESQKKHYLLESVVGGLYVEIEKLTKKAPAETVTDLALDQINEVIKDTKNLLSDDSYIEKLNIFVPAGDLPQLRDTLLVLRQIKQGLERSSHKWDTTTLSEKLKSANIVKSALQHSLQGMDDEEVFTEIEKEIELSLNYDPQMIALLRSIGGLPNHKALDEWTIRDHDAYRNRIDKFDFERLENIVIENYFRV